MKVVPILSKRGHEPPLPRPFDVPQNFPQTISTGLISHKLTGKPRAKFITIIAQSIYRHKSYPTDEEYIHVAQELVNLSLAFSEAFSLDVGLSMLRG